jgi:signal transduction histidine kinase
MLQELLSNHRATLIERCRARVVHRLGPTASSVELEHGIPLFIDQLIETLEMPLPARPARNVGSRNGTMAPKMGISAQQHGRDLLGRGFTVEQVVRDYGDLCQEITGLALEFEIAIDVEDFRTLNLCLDDAIADAVTEFSYQRDTQVAMVGAKASNARMGFLAHELRNSLGTAMLATAAIKSGNVGLAGATGAVLDRSLVGMRDLIDRSLAEVRSSAGIPQPVELFAVSDFIDQVRASASLEAASRHCLLSVSSVDAALAVEGDRDALFTAVMNLLQNAFKFTRPHTEVKLSAFAASNRVLITVEDCCGGLSEGDEKILFLPFKQVGGDKAGLGLGLAISRQSVESNKGVLSVRNLPGAGCVFSIDLPRHTTAEAGVRRG